MKSNETRLSMIHMLHFQLLKSHMWPVLQYPKVWNGAFPGVCFHSHCFEPWIETFQHNKDPSVYWFLFSSQRTSTTTSINGHLKSPFISSKHKSQFLSQLQTKCLATKNFSTTVKIPEAKSWGTYQSRGYQGMDNLFSIIHKNGKGSQMKEQEFMQTHVNQVLNSLQIKRGHSNIACWRRRK